MSLQAPALLPALALAFNAFTWGVSWWPFRQLQALGLHPLWATVLIYGLAVLYISLLRPRAWRRLARERGLWVLMLASGGTNVCFNWGVTLGDVVRVILLFYVMPLWAVLLARLVLGEALTLRAALRVLLALCGAAVVLWPAQGGWPLPRSAADALGLLGGFCFALNNVMLRRQTLRQRAQGSEGAQDNAAGLAMFLGGAAVSALLAAGLASQGRVPWPPAPAPLWMAAVAVLGLLFLCSNLALQYGVARLSANVTAVIMLVEVVFAASSAVALGAGTVTTQLALGGALIVGAALLAARSGGAPAGGDTMATPPPPRNAP